MKSVWAPGLILLALPACLGDWEATPDQPTTSSIALHPRCETVYPEGLTLPVDPEQTFLIGTLFDHTLDTHQGRYKAAQLAADQANTNGGLEGREFAMIHCTNEEGTGLDELTKDDASVEAAVWLAETVGVPAIVGPAASSRTEAVYNAVAADFGTLVISPSATSPSLTPLDGLDSTNTDPGLLWRTAPPDDIQGAAIAWDMLNNYDDTGATNVRLAPSLNVAVIYQSGAYGEGLEAVFTDEFLAQGGVNSDGFPFANDGARADAIADVANGGYDEVLFVSSDSSDVIAFLLGTDSVGGFDGIPLFLTDGARNVDVLNEAASASSRFSQVRGTAPAQPAGPIYDSFAASFAAEYGGLDVTVLSYTAQSFDAAWLVFMGHAWAFHQTDGISGENIARGLRQVSSGDAVSIRPTSWNLVKAAFQSGVSVDVEGASGLLDYDSSGETSASIDVWTIAPSDDDFITVETFEP